MADAPTLSPELSRSVSAVARSLVAASRGWALYPPEHPALRAALERLRAAVTDAGAGQIVGFGVTPDTLLVAGIPLDGRHAAAAADAARWLHDRDILELTFVGDVSLAALQQLLGLLTEDSRVIRQRGGPAKVWRDTGEAAIAVQQIDFSRVLQDGEPAAPVRRKDDLWRTIVRGVLDRRRPNDEAAQARLLEIAGDTVAIGELASDVIAPHHTVDGSPMLTSQAAAVVAAYHHLVSIVDVLAPDRKQDVLRNLAVATATLSPRVVMQMLSDGAVDGQGASSGATAVVTGLVAAMDDARVAQLLATTLAIEGKATERLATVFNTIVTDDDRKHRVLRMTRRLLGETDFGRRDGYHTLWSSMEELLLTYNERPFVSAGYKAGLDQVAARAEHMATDVPADLAELVDTLGQDNVRRLSVRLLIDLLQLERDPVRAPEIASDVATLAEDLLLAGDYDSVLSVVTALQEQAANHGSAASQGSRVALDGLVSTVAFVEACALLGDMTGTEATTFAAVCARIGPAAIDGLRAHFEQEAGTPGRTRAGAIVRSYGARGISRLAPLVGSPNWAAQRNAAELLGATAAPDAVPLLQTLLRGRDPRVSAAAVRALAGIKDPSAARAVHTALRAATGDQRRAVVDALVSERDARVVPVLVRIVEESDPFGADHPIVLETVGALSRLGDDQAVPVLSALMRRRKLLAPRKGKALKETSLAALRAIQTPAAARAIDEAARTGDRMLRKLARAGA